MWRRTLERLVGGWRRRPVPIWYDVAYRLPLAAVEGQSGIEPRRADLVVWHLLARRILSSRALNPPRLVSYEELARVHTPEHLESLSRPDTLARIFAVDPSEVAVDEVLRTVRLACGGTLEAARAALRSRGPCDQSPRRLPPRRARPRRRAVPGQRHGGRAGGVARRRILRPGGDPRLRRPSARRYRRLSAR
jgi:hypothetical protein